MNDLISVVVPIYNVEEYLDECIESIVNQTYKNLEIILIDDGSSDNCPNICDKWAKKDKRIKVIHKENTGVATARKMGILSAKGQFICCVDSDDYIDKKLCESVLRIFQNNDVDIVVYNVECFGLGGNNAYSKTITSEKILDSETALQKLVGNDIPNYFGNKAYKRSVFDGVDFVDGRLWEDLGSMYSIFLNAQNIYFCAEKLYYYRMREGSIIHSMNEKALEDIFFVQMKRYCELLKIYPDIANIAFEGVALSAIRLYDRALWKKVDAQLLEKAVEFLSDNKKEILSLENKKRYIWFYRNRWLYNTVRVLRHGVGNVVKKLK